jgi:hypothetical protein
MPIGEPPRSTTSLGRMPPGRVIGTMRAMTRDQQHAPPHYNAPIPFRHGQKGTAIEGIVIGVYRPVK